MLSQDKFHKLCKYSLRLEKSFITGDINNYTKYCSHLKHHIGGSNTKLDEMFNGLIEIIKKNQTDADGNIVDYDTLKKNVQRYEEDNFILSNEYDKLQIDNEQLQNRVLEFEKNINNNGDTINELQIQNNKILADNNELNTKIQKYKAIIDTVNLKLNEINDNDNLNIDNNEYEQELKTVLEQFKTKLETSSASYDANNETIAENTILINDLTEQNTNLKKKIEELDQANQNKDKELLDKDKEFEQYKLDNDKAIEQAIEDTKNTDVVEFKNKLVEILGTIYGQPLAQAIISGAKLGETQPEITVSEEDKLVKGTKLAEQVVKNPKEQLLESEFEIYSVKKKTNDKRLLTNILNVNTQGKDKMDNLDIFKNKVNTLLDNTTLENLDETKTEIQNLINDVTGKEEGKLRISNTGNLQFGGNF